MNGIIYKATNKINGKEYVGQTIQSLSARKSRHLNDALKGVDFHFHRSIRKYGSENFKWNIVENIKTDSINILNYREQHFISYFKTFTNGYNSTTGGLNNFCSEETKCKMSVIRKGKPLSKTHRNSLTKISKTKQWNEKNSKAHCKILWFVQTPIKDESDFWCFNLKKFAKNRKVNFGWLSSNHSCKGYKVQRF